MLIEGRKKKSNFPVPLKQKVLLRWLFVLTAMFHKGQKSCLTALLIIFPRHSLKRTRTASALQQLVNNIISFITVCSTMRGFCNYGLNMSPEAGEPWCSACVTDWLVCLTRLSESTQSAWLKKKKLYKSTSLRENCFFAEVAYIWGAISTLHYENWSQNWHVWYPTCRYSSIDLY